MPEEVIEDVSTNKLSFGHAKAISRLSDEDILSIVHLIYEKKLSVRQLENMTNSPVEFHRKKEIRRREASDSEYSYIASTLCDKLGTRVRIKKNKVEIKFENAADLTRILEIMQLDK